MLAFVALRHGPGAKARRRPGVRAWQQQPNRVITPKEHHVHIHMHNRLRLGECTRSWRLRAFDLASFPEFPRPRHRGRRLRSTPGAADGSRFGLRRHDRGGGRGARPAQAITSGSQNVVIAADVENMTRVPMGSPFSVAATIGLGDEPISEHVQKRFGVSEFSQFNGAQMVAGKYGFDQQTLDRFALTAITAPHS